TRFWITLDQGVQFVIDSLNRMNGGEIFVPKIPSMKVTDLAEAIAPDCEIEVIGIRPGEKLHETMITEDDARRTVEFDTHYVIQPEFPWWNDKYTSSGKPLQDGFSYVSNTNEHWLSVVELRNLVNK
ncbi:MAG TPA: polysaccharide biosynthesis protein, partial [Ureibacillus sp.]|nr:polysaccharide biosynthesis protein [Ureibacillus sp.]